MSTGAVVVLLCAQDLEGRPQWPSLWVASRSWVRMLGDTANGRVALLSSPFPDFHHCLFLVIIAQSESCNINAHLRYYAVLRKFEEVVSNFIQL